jgi:hypothetical protein
MDENKDCAPKRERFSVARCAWGGGGRSAGGEATRGRGGKSVHALTYTLLGVFSVSLAQALAGVRAACYRQGLRYTFPTRGVACQGGAQGSSGPARGLGSS